MRGYDEVLMEWKLKDCVAFDSATEEVVVGEFIIVIDEACR